MDKSATTGANNGTSWGDAFTRISGGIQASNHNDDLWVAATEYIEAVTVDKYLKIYGGFSGNEDELDERYLEPDTTTINAATAYTHAATFTADATLDSFIIKGGDATNGGGVHIKNASPGLVNCVIALNDASSHGGGVYCTGSSPRLVNCTIVHNEAEGLYATGSSNPVLTNCIIWENDGSDQVASDITSSSSINYSCIQGVTQTGTGNISSNPRFRNPMADWRLRHGSPCEDAGDPTTSVSKDILGDPRTRDSTGEGYDIGAYELDKRLPEVHAESSGVQLEAFPGHLFLGEANARKSGNDTTHADVWLSNWDNIGNSTDANVTLWFDSGVVAHIEMLKIWNHPNALESTGIDNAVGIKQARISTSLDGVHYTVLDATPSTTDVLDPFPFAKAPDSKTAEKHSYHDRCRCNWSIRSL